MQEKQGRKRVRGRPRSETQTSVLTARVPDSTAQRVRNHAIETEQTVSDIVEAAMAEYLAKRGIISK